MHGLVRDSYQKETGGKLEQGTRPRTAATLPARAGLKARHVIARPEGLGKMAPQTTLAL